MALSRRCCADFEKSQALFRRQFLQAGSLAAFGLTLPDLLRAESGRSALSSGRRPRAKACILVYLCGGPSHIDLWDMKPNASEEIRGEFKPAATKTPGLALCELLPRLGQMTEQLALVRSMTHELLPHRLAVGLALTGARTTTSAAADRPNWGSTILRFKPASGMLPTAVTLPNTMGNNEGAFMPGQTAGMLGDRYKPWFIEKDPNAADFRIEGLNPPAEVSAERLTGRQALLSSIEDQQRALDGLAEARQMNDHYQKAFDLLTSAHTQEAFRIEREPAALRDRFGRTTFGQSCLLACRLIEAGVRFVQVNMGTRPISEFGWDTHDNNFKSLRKPLLPVFDPGYATLLETLRARGLLQETLVVCMGEFGRTPRIDKGRGQGRDHWPRCYTVLLAGAGIAGGAVHGQSDKIGAFPAADPVSPEDLTATVYHALGIDPEAEIHDQQKRPYQLVQGKPLHKLWGD